MAIAPYAVLVWQRGSDISILIVFLVLLLISLIIPIIIVMKWHRRQFAALVVSSLIYMLPLFLVLMDTIIAGNHPHTGLSLFTITSVFMTIWLLIGLLILVPIQWKAEKIESVARKKILRLPFE